ncbi:hypothetical protein C4K04_3013 [Pseudomonas chlororaphis]|uniref:Uncharacterized protein n=1 Tax=Pseudomonas chlororaphis TaxID=587753 RepID=A0A3G7TNI6_9PSED|nr:hypothetical protein C4K04_3013 [Pseudomonas chlororaphis]
MWTRSTQRIVPLYDRMALLLQERSLRAMNDDAIFLHCA